MDWIILMSFVTANIQVFQIAFWELATKTARPVFILD